MSQPCCLAAKFLWGKLHAYSQHYIKGSSFGEAGKIDLKDLDLTQNKTLGSIFHRVTQTPQTILKHIITFFLLKKTKVKKSVEFFSSKKWYNKKDLRSRSWSSSIKCIF